MINVGIFGGSGYAGKELISLLLKHSRVNISFITSEGSTGKDISNIFMDFTGRLSKKLISSSEGINKLNEIDFAFLSLPHGKGFEISSAAIKKNKKVIDLSGNFRLDNPDDYMEWYGFKHPDPSFLNKKIYGLTEINKNFIKSCNYLSNPGCYPTASILGLYPLIKGFSEKIDTESIIIDSKSGVSGAGKTPSKGNIYCEINENIRPYGIGIHKHKIEIKQELQKITTKKTNITFIPHLVPFQRGILSTIYVKTENTDIKSIIDYYKDFYHKSPFVKIIDLPSETRWVTHSNNCFINISMDKGSKTLVITSAIDNLLKGASGQAVQNFNVMTGLDETLSLI